MMNDIDIINGFLNNEESVITKFYKDKERTAEENSAVLFTFLL